MTSHDKTTADAAVGFLEILPVAVVTANTAGECLSVNQRYCDLVGSTSGEMLGQVWWQAVLPQDAARLIQSWEEFVVVGNALRADFRMVRPDGKVIWLYAQALQPSGQGLVPTAFAVVLTDISELKAAEHEMAHFAFYDVLTGLPNRRLLMDRLIQVVKTASRSKKNAALLFMDLDNFKSLNDTMGHHKGDVLLQQVANRLKGAVRTGDTVARLGGDEFVAVLENLSPRLREAARQVRAVAEKIMVCLNAPYDLAGLEHYSTPSMGITMFGTAQDSVEEMMKRADMAMYQAKAAGRNTFRFFDPEMQAVITARVALESELRIALHENQLVLHYQPKMSVEGVLTGAEAFVRWLHPTRGLVSPATFIPLAEETGLIVALGNFVLTAACRQLHQWSARQATAHLSMEVKVSGQQLRQSDFVTVVLQTLYATGAKPELLKLELNESLLVVDVEDIIEKTTELSKSGVVFSLADLGTGYSSLSHLRRLALDQLRIDQSFVRGLLTNSDDEAVTRSIFALADSLKLKVGAEGVETQEQRDVLASHGCIEFQGYLFSQPLRVDEFEALLLRQSMQEEVV
jgi:diguanylate cyclase (GGDEF)-like protein/PAS domain S-box-containing protein